MLGWPNKTYMVVAYMGEELGGVPQEGIEVGGRNNIILVDIDEAGPLAFARFVELDHEVEDALALGRRLAQDNSATLPSRVDKVVRIALLAGVGTVKDVFDGKLVCGCHDCWLLLYSMAIVVCRCAGTTQILALEDREPEGATG